MFEKQGAFFPLRPLPKTQRSLDEQLKDAGLPDPDPEYMFGVSLGRRWRFDYCWPEPRIALELEGAPFGRMVETATGEKVRIAGGRHTTGAGMEADCEKYSWAAILGWCVVRVTPAMVRRGQAITLLREAFRHRTKREA